ncbi:MAG: hypothetical protein OEZ36_07115 [Spirochaetota bacterium]|nr:hypothetical protein [Spirochaetota bacterium]
MIIDYVILISAIFITAVLVIIIFLLAIRKWIKAEPRARKALFSYFNLDEYHNLVRDTFLKLHEQNGKLQNIVKHSVGKDHTEVTNALIQSYKEMDEVMDKYLLYQKEIEEKLFLKDRVDQQ